MWDWIILPAGPEDMDLEDIEEEISGFLELLTEAQNDRIAALRHPSMIRLRVKGSTIHVSPGGSLF